MRSSAGCLFRTSCCVAVLAILTASASAASLGGTVTYKTSGMSRPDALTSALVSAYHTATGRKAVTRTNNLGMYFFKDLPGGLYIILIEKDGRRVYQGKVEAREQANRFDVPL